MLENGNDCPARRRNPQAGRRERAFRQLVRTVEEIDRRIVVFRREIVDRRYLRACEEMDRTVRLSDDPEAVLRGLAGWVEMLRGRYVDEKRREES